MSEINDDSLSSSFIENFKQNLFGTTLFVTTGDQNAVEESCPRNDLPTNSSTNSREFYNSQKLVSAANCEFETMLPTTGPVHNEEVYNRVNRYQVLDSNFKVENSPTARVKSTPSSRSSFSSKRSEPDHRFNSNNIRADYGRPFVMRHPHPAPHSPLLERPTSSLKNYSMHRSSITSAFSEAAWLQNNRRSSAAHMAASPPNKRQSAAHMYHHFDDEKCGQSYGNPRSLQQLDYRHPANEIDARADNHGSEFFFSQPPNSQPATSPSPQAPSPPPFWSRNRWSSGQTPGPFAPQFPLSPPKLRSQNPSKTLPFCHQSDVALSESNVQQALETNESINSFVQQQNDQLFYDPISPSLLPDNESKQPNKENMEPATISMHHEVDMIDSALTSWGLFSESEGTPRLPHHSNKRASPQSSCQNQRISLLISSPVSKKSPRTDTLTNNIQYLGNHEPAHLEQFLTQAGDPDRPEVQRNIPCDQFKHSNIEISRHPGALQTSLSWHQTFDDKISKKITLDDSSALNRSILENTHVYGNGQDNKMGTGMHEGERTLRDERNYSQENNVEVRCNQELKESALATKSDDRDISRVWPSSEVHAVRLPTKAHSANNIFEGANKTVSDDADSSQANMQSNTLFLPWNQSQEDKWSCNVDVTSTFKNASQRDVAMHSTSSTPTSNIVQATKRSPFEVPDIVSFKKRAAKKFTAAPTQASMSCQTGIINLHELNESAQKADTGIPEMAPCIPAQQSLSIVTEIATSSSSDALAEAEPSKDTLEAAKIRTSDEADTGMPEMAPCIPAQQSLSIVTEIVTSRSSDALAEAEPSKDTLEAAKIRTADEADTGMPEMAPCIPAQQSLSIINESAAPSASDALAEAEPSKDTLEAAKILSTFSDVTVQKFNEVASPNLTSACFSARQSELGKRKATAACKLFFESSLTNNFVNSAEKSCLIDGMYPYGSGDCIRVPESLHESRCATDNEPQKTNDFRLLHGNKLLRGMQSTITWFHVVNLCLAHEVSGSV